MTPIPIKRLDFLSELFEVEPLRQRWPLLKVMKLLTIILCLLDLIDLTPMPVGIDFQFTTVLLPQSGSLRSHEVSTTAR